MDKTSVTTKAWLRSSYRKHSFQECLSPYCKCRKGEVETSSHNLLHCSDYLEERLTLLNTVNFGSNSFDNNKNTFILDAIKI